MSHFFYEHHNHTDPDFPIIFHKDYLDINNNSFIMHYHDNIELLYFIDGNGIVGNEKNSISTSTGDVIVINSNSLHTIQLASERCSYYCLIIDKEFCESQGIFINDITIQDLIQDSTIIEYFNTIITEIDNKNLYFKAAIKSTITSLLIYLCRNYSTTLSPSITNSNNKKILLVKNVINYIKNHFLEDICIDDICINVGISKYYLCRIFKEITGKTILDYINFLRCDNARKLLLSGKYNVSESALNSGFNNLSYFSKIYKKYIGKLPSS